jgi:hypothetical protein
MFKRLAILFLAINFLWVSSGVVLCAHFCGNILTNVAINGDTSFPKCACDKNTAVEKATFNKKNSCCNEHLLVFKVKEVLQKQSAQLHWTPISFNNPSENLVSMMPITAIHSVSYTPFITGSITPRYLLYHNIRV